VIPNHRVPAVSHMLWFKIGSADEAAGMSGLAHYLEHMMFKGTDKLKVGEYSQTVSKYGGNHNAFTSYDYTGYYVNIAKEHLPLVMELESDRMVNLKVDDEEFLKEREVIMEERSMRLDNRPAAVLEEQMMATLFQRHPYHTEIIGWRHEMEALSKEQVFDMYHRYYHPNNVVLVVAGDMTAAELKPLAEKYYGSLPKGELMERNWTEEPPHNSELRVIHRDAKVQQPAFSRLYLAPSYVHGETPYAEPVDLMSSILGDGMTSWLYRKLVIEQKVATGASASYYGMKLGPATFSVDVIPADGVSMEVLEAAVDGVIREFVQNGPAEDELARAKTEAKASVIYVRDGLQSLAYIIGQLKMIGLDEAFLNDWPKRIEAVTTDQVRQAAQMLFKPERSVTGWLMPEAEAGDVAKEEADVQE
ncbi:MAG: M16 family metallopeptidase, partial [Rickettsiales bacterium]